jgi:hypothetical protein
MTGDPGTALFGFFDVHVRLAVDGRVWGSTWQSRASEEACYGLQPAGFGLSVTITLSVPSVSLITVTPTTSSAVAHAQD